MDRLILRHPVWHEHYSAAAIVEQLAANEHRGWGSMLVLNLRRGCTAWDPQNIDKEYTGPAVVTYTADGEWGVTATCRRNGAPW